MLMKPSSDKKTPTPAHVSDDVVRIVWMALSGRIDDLRRYLERIVPNWQEVDAPLAQRIQELLNQPTIGPEMLRRVAPAASAVGSSSAAGETADLLRIETSIELPVEPVWSVELKTALDGLIKERRAADRLARAGLTATRTVIFTGPPGVGKSLAARWIARELNLPLFVLNLGTVMSSFLGRTGTNLRQVMQHAAAANCVLFLDEIDAIAKRRDDNTDVGELKRLVTVLLQELDAWPSTGLLLAATNHEDLLDPAVWRRFERRVIFPLPSAEQQAELFGRLLGAAWNSLPAGLEKKVTLAATGLSPSDITQIATRAKREAVLNDGNLAELLVKHTGEAVHCLPLPRRRQIGLQLKRARLGQREICRLTGLARETIRSLEG